MKYEKEKEEEEFFIFVLFWGEAPSILCLIVVGRSVCTEALLFVFS